MTFHLAGLIPLAGQPLDFNMPWHDSLMPVGPNYLAVERSIVECANAGCETIWIICNNDVQPLIRHRLGEYVQDPVWVTRHYSRNKGNYKKPIPIYYVPLNIRDKDKKDCMAWSLLHGCYIAKNISGKMSTWLKPNKYYVSFPYGYYGPTLLREHRKDISTSRNFFIQNKDKTALDGEFLGFTFGPEDYHNLLNRYRQSVIEKSKYVFSIEEIFDVLDLEKSGKIDVLNYWNISKWENYCQYMSEQGYKTKRPSEFILKYHEWNDIGVD